MRFRSIFRPALAFSATALLAWAAPAMPAAAASSPSDIGTVHQSQVKSAHPGSGAAGTSNNLYYHGGVGSPAIGVETGADKVYIVQWGWSGDPSLEGPRQLAFFQGVGGSTWNNSVTQYCQGVTAGTFTCGTSGTHATNPTGVYAATWADNVNRVPRHITQSSLAAEAVLAAAHFGNTGAVNNTVQYVIDTPHGHSMNGFGTQWCAWHSSTTSSYGNIAYTNFPYITDAGASCGQNFVNGGSAGTLDGVTIVGGHEFAETETDIFPNGGWLDSGGAENGDKCAWISSGPGASANFSFSTGTFAVQSLWSNAFNGGAGGCVP